MTTFFYLLGFIFLVEELINFLFPKWLLERKAHVKSIDPKSNTGREQKLKDLKFLLRRFLFLASYSLWSIIGLFTVEWFHFVVLISLGSLTQYFSKKITSEKETLLLIRVDALLSCLIIAIITNSHFNLLEYLPK